MSVTGETGAIQGAGHDRCLRKFTNLLTAEEIKFYSRLSGSRFLLAILVECLTLALAIGVCETHWNIALYLLVVLVIGARMHGLGILMHEAAHFRGCPGGWNDIAGEALALIFPFSMREYRHTHFAHHRELNGPEDPDWRRNLDSGTYDFPKTRVRMILTLLRYASGLQIVNELKTAYADPSPGSARPGLPPGLKAVRIAFALMAVGSAAAFGLWEAYLLYWIVPFCTSLLFFSYIRSIAEHFADLPCDTIWSQSRTVLAPPWERWLFAPHNINYHIEHHLYPSVPFFRLADLHAHLMTRTEYATQAHITRGYVRGLFKECTGGGDR